MLILILCLLLLTWLFREWLKIRKVLNVASQVKCSFMAFPLIGHGHMFIGDGIRRMESLKVFGREAIKQGGLTHLWMGRKYLVVVADAVDIEMVSKSCLEKDALLRFAKKLTENGSIFAPVPIWRPRRKILAPTFSPKNLNNFVNIFSKQSSMLVEQLKDVAGKGSFPIWKYLTSYTMDSVCETALGVDLAVQTQKDSPLLKSFGYLLQLIAERVVRPWLHPDWLYEMLPTHDAFSKDKKVLCDFVDTIIKLKRESLKEAETISSLDQREGSNDNRNKTFLELLIEASGGEKGYSDKELQEETLVILLAGTDTSAVGACFTTVMLSRHPEVQDKVYQELQEVFGDSDRPLTAKDLPRLKYLEAVVKETLRLYPPVPAVARKVETDVTLPSGLTLVPGCGVLFHIWALQRNPRYWGKDAEVFRPERFYDSLPSHPMAYMAFSAGPRNCLGYQYAMMSMKTAVASLLRRYRLLPSISCKNTNTDLDLRLTYDIMMKDYDQFTVQLESRL